jgi:hypothetical protein
VVHARTDENIQRLMAALTELDARYRDPAGRVLLPDPRALGGPGRHLFHTSCGPLDVLGTIGRGEAYETLVHGSRPLGVAGREFRVLDLPGLIRAKEAAGRDKDQAVLPILRRTLKERDDPSR